MSKVVETRTYQRHECAVFRKTDEAFGGLSNMAPGYPLEINGIRIRTSEALYQACRFPQLPDVQRLIIDERSPMTAKMRSKPYRDKTRQDWQSVRVKIMRWCLRVKLAQNWNKFHNLLLSTGEKPIVEESRKDSFWGTKPTEQNTLVGGNVLGRLLMELREELRSLNNQSMIEVGPPEIPNFLLFGEPIGVVKSDLKQSTDNIELFSEKVNQDDEKKAVEPRMIPKECKRLAEVDFPIAVVSKNAVREKSGPKGHLSTLHLWWARRPLSSCRAILLGLLLPDPCDPKCPEEFKKGARELLRQVPGKIGSSDIELQHALLRFIGDFADWNLSTDRTFLNVSHELIRISHLEENPLVVDPFAGGGSIPLEALRLGCDVLSSDLNPVACLMEKVMLEDIPRHGSELAQQLQIISSQLLADAEGTLSKFYPFDDDGSQPIAYIWARTVNCEAPNCGAEIPLVRSFWLSKKGNRISALRYHVRRPKGQLPYLEFEIFKPKKANEVPNGTVSKAKATCPCCHTVLSPDRVRSQLSQQRGGADVIFDKHHKRTGGAFMLTVVTVRTGEQGKRYRLPTKNDYHVVAKASQYLDDIISKTTLNRNDLIPDEYLPPIGTLGFRVQRYGIQMWSELFSVRQKLSLVTWLLLIKKLYEQEPNNPILASLSLALSRVAMCGMSLTNWNAFAEKMQHVFGRQALPMVWDFAEVVSIRPSPGSWPNAIELIKDVASTWSFTSTVGQVQISDATSMPLPDNSVTIWFTDPPYYDAVPYADLSDFFYVWLKRALPGHPLLRDPYDPKNRLTPKRQEAVQDDVKNIDGQPKNRSYFEEKMAMAFKEGRRILKEDGIGCVVFAHKTTEGWEALLTGMIRGGWVITGSWPIATEGGTRLRARESAALATSVHLICRPRTEDNIGDWGEVLRELPKRVGDWIERLQGEHVRGADLVFACIGPALEIFSRYSRVETADGKEVPLADYLLKVWEVVGRTALEQVLGTAEAKARNGVAGALEEDARLTALFLWTLQSTNGNDAAESESDEEGDEDEEEAGAKGKKGGYSLIYDVARRFAQPLGIHLGKWEGRIIETQKGVVRLLSVHERAKQLFGEEGVHAVAEQMKHKRAESLQMTLFAHSDLSSAAEMARPGRKKKTKIEISDDAVEARKIDATTLDRVHAAMLLQAGGQSNALRALLKAEQERSQDFLRLANALSALYPRESEEKRLLDAMLLAVPR